jgi:hypothetical protein
MVAGGGVALGVALAVDWLEAFLVALAGFGLEGLGLGLALPSASPVDTGSGLLTGPSPEPRGSSGGAVIGAAALQLTKSGDGGLRQSPVPPDEYQ